jgi:pyroglutamyl-peptidase
MRTILVTGFGPFPCAPINPTEALMSELSGKRLAGIRVATHVFATSYAAVNNDLPALLRRDQPDALLMFGFAAGTPHLRIETWARNAISLSEDATGTVPRQRFIAPGRTPRLALPTFDRELLAAARRARVPATISTDAGDYLCNYLCWHAALAAKKRTGPKVAAFVHVPETVGGPELVRAGYAFLAAAVRHVYARNLP